jgi:hypothetical protein
MGVGLRLDECAATDLELVGGVGALDEAPACAGIGRLLGLELAADGAQLEVVQVVVVRHRAERARARGLAGQRAWLRSVAGAGGREKECTGARWSRTDQRRMAQHVARKRPAK